MKKIKFLAVFLFLILGAQRASSQIIYPSRTSFNYIDMLNYMANCRQEIALRVRNAIFYDNLKTYKDAELKNELQFNAFIDLISIKDDRQIPNPENPDDIYDLIDTVIVYEVFPDAFVFFENGTIACVNTQGATFYIKFKEIKKHFDARLQSAIAFCTENGEPIFTDIHLMEFSKKQVSALGKTLYNYGIEGKIKAYREDSLKQLFSVEEIIERTAAKENQSIPNPDNPDDKYDLIDTVITTPLNTDSINTVRVYFTWETKGFESKAKFYSIAPLFKPLVAGIELPLTPIFHIKASDYLKTLNKTEKTFWQYFYMYLLQNKSSGGLYDYYFEDKLPQEEHNISY